MKNGIKSTELWLSVAIIAMVILFSTILAAMGKLTGTQWVNMVGTVATMLGGVYSVSRTGAKIAEQFKRDK